MLRAIIYQCLRQPVIVILLVLVGIFYGWHSTQEVPIDAIPDIGESQVIVLTSWPGRSPKDVEDQITNPLSVQLLKVPHAKSVRGKSMFGYSFVQVTFEDNVDFYWARSRVAEQLTAGSSKLPEGVSPTLGPDATGLGQIFYYVLKAPMGVNLAQLRSIQDFTVKYAFESVEGVSEVASIGGYVRQYQIDIDPDLLRFHNVSLDKVLKAVKAANLDVGAKTIESNDMEFLVRGKGFLGANQDPQKAITDLEETVVLTRQGVPLRIRHLGHVHLGADFRRGALDLNGAEAVGGVVVMRFGENPRKVIERVKAKIASLEPSLNGVKIEAIYDRTGLIDETIDTLSEALLQEIVITIVVIVLFLLHVRASLVVAVTLPLAVLIAFIAMNVFGVDANIMSLAGIAIAIGTMVDMGIIVSENIYRHLADWEAEGSPGGNERRLQVIHEAAAEVAPAVLTAVSTTVISFLPVFALTGRDHKLFAPLAWTKTFALVASLIVAIVLVPLLCRFLLKSTRKKKRDLLGNWFYAPTLRFFLRHKLLFLTIPLCIVVLGVGAWIGLPTILQPVEDGVTKLGADLNKVPGYVKAKHTFTGLKSDDWIALDEGSWFYMPVLYPAAGFGQAMQVLQTQDMRIKQIPEVQNVLGKIGRADSALDPAPAAMIETYVMLKPKEQWREGRTAKDIWNDITSAASMLGVTPAAPLQPIEGRVVMLQSGIKASMAVRIYGDNLKELSEAAFQVAEQIKTVPQVNAATVNPDVVLGKPYLEFTVDREKAARYGMSVQMVNQIIETAIGGMNLTTTVEGRERYPVRVRYLRNYREQQEALKRLPVVTHSGQVVPMSELVHTETSWGPGMISSEDARLVAHVSFSPSGKAGDLETVEAVMRSLQRAQSSGELSLPQGYELQPVGSFQNQIEANNRLRWLVPTVILINLFLIYLQFRHLPISLTVFAGIPVAFGGGMILLGIMNIEINTAVWVGFIALFGIAVDDGVVIATYLNQVFTRRQLRTVEDIRAATVEAGLKRIRPCLMTTFTTLAALAPVLMSTGRGSDVAKAMALPVFGGMLVELITLFVVPVVFCGYKEIKMRLGLYDRHWQGTEVETEAKQGNPDASQTFGTVDVSQHIQGNPR